jgi:hypothetical protein
MASTSPEDFVGVVAILCVFGLPLTYAIVNRVLSHQERIEMLKHGITPPLDSKWAKRMYKAGFDPNMYAQPGGMQQQYGSCFGVDADPNRTLRRGISLTCIGIGLTVGLSFINPGRPGPWLLGGLIPLFVGIAQVVIAMLSGAGGARSVMGGPWGPVPPPPPSGGRQQPSGQQPFSGSRDVTPGYGAWRPGPATGLEKPPSPPDVR